MKITVIESLGVKKEILESKFRSFFPESEVVFYEQRGNDEELKERGKDSDIIIVANQPISQEVAEHWKKVKLLSVAFTGLDHIPVEYLEKRGVTVLNAAGYSNVAVAELVFGLIFAWKRQIPQNDQITRAGEKQSLPGTELYGKTFGVLGTGAIGSTVCRLALAFGCKVIAWNRSVKDISGVEWKTKEEVLSQADIISLHLPSTKETQGLIGEKELSLIQKHALFVNAARGKIVDEEALVNALKERRFAAALLDVFYSEPPLSKDHPLLSLDNVLLTPHIAFYTEEALMRRLDIVLEKIQNFLKS